MRKHLSLLLLFTTFSAMVFAQADRKTPLEMSTDTNYIDMHANELTVRLYGSNKFTRYAISEQGRDEPVRYRPNSNYNVGFGFGYRFLGVNIGFKTPGINADNEKHGKTKYLDLQSYVYARKMTLDIYAQQYKGYYLGNNKVLSAPPTTREYLLREDLRTRNIGGNFEYLFNGDRFSYRAIYLQNERQKKSAGSFIVGGGIHYLVVDGDSSLIPTEIKYRNFADNRSFNRSNMAWLSVNGGYAHTFVFAKNFFVMGSLLVGAGINHTTIKNEATNFSESKWGPSINGIARLGVGYNSDRYYAGAFFVNNLMQNATPIDDTWQRYETGLIRVAVAKRFTLKKKVVDKFDRVEGAFKKK